jgi:NodT family efflux transporter outer membrane factor (OMF) lipoprotein
MQRLGVLRLAQLAVILASLMPCLVGCSGTRQWYENGFKVGPNYCSPPAPAAANWMDSGASHIRSEDRDYSYWWTAFNDPVLDQLVETASRQNVPLQTAASRIMEARATLGVAVGELFPQQQQMTGQYTRVEYSKKALPFGAIGSAFPKFPLAWDDFSVGMNASWELDFWGQYRRGIESANANFDAQVESYDNVLVILQADVATNYIQMRAFQERLALATRNVDIQRRSLEIAQARFNAGVVTELDVQQAKATLATTESLIPTLQIGERQTRNRLCVLMGIPPQDLDKEIGPSGTVPSPPVEVVVGIPANLLRRRPDIRLAERQAAAQSARIGIAEAEFYPHLSITGNFGFEAQNFSQLFNQNAFMGQVGPGFRWNILNYGRIGNNVRAEDARFQQAVLNYRDTVLRAHEEVENSIHAFLREQVRVKSLEESAVAAARSVELALQQYQKGLANYQPVLDSERVLVQQQDSTAQSRAMVAADLVAIYRALAGGWMSRLQVPSAEEASPSLPNRETIR